MRKRWWRWAAIWSWLAGRYAQAPNDKQQVEPMLAELGAMQKNVGPCATLLADTGYYSAGNVEACQKVGIQRRIIAYGRRPDHPPLSERLEAKPNRRNRPLENPVPTRRWW